MSDLHLGVDGTYSSRERERRVSSFLLGMANEISHLYLVGDVFDYWYEWRQVIPAGFSRWWSTVVQLQDAGVQIQAHAGNHDLWQYRYLQDEFSIPVHCDPIDVEHFGYKLHIAHGDGLGPGDYGYKFFKTIMTNRMAQWALSRLHPNFTMTIMKKLSHKSREHGEDSTWLGADREWLVQYAEAHLASNKSDFYVFGHRHLPIDHLLSNGVSRYIGLGDWLHFETYAILDESGLFLNNYGARQLKIYG